MIKPGGTLGGFITQSSAPPAVVRYYLQGYSGKVCCSSEDLARQDILTNSITGYTLGTRDTTVSVSLLQWLDSLSYYSTQSRSLGWIKDQSTADKYSSLLTKAKTQLQSEDSSGSRQTLQAVVTNTISDSTANITSEAYALLRFNTEYLISNLPVPQFVPFVNQVSDLVSLVNQTLASGQIGDTAFVNSLNKQLSNSRKNIGNGKVAQGITVINIVLSRVEKAYDNTTKRQQQGKSLPKSFVTQSGWTTLSQQINQLLQNLQSIGTTINVPGQFTTIQAAIKAAKAGTTIAVEAGTYNEFLTINNEDSLTLLALDNATIQGVHIAKSSVITIKGFTIDASTTNKDAVQIEGTENSDITIEANQIQNSVGNGITLGKNNSDTKITNNVIVNNQKNGIDCSNGTSGAQYIVNNTIVDNGFNGIEAALQQDLFIVNNIISFNGTSAGASGGRYGVKRNADASATEITLLNNLIVGNNGKVDKKNSKDLSSFAQILDGTDSQDITTSGTEGIGISGSSTVQQAEVLQADFRLIATSIAIDTGTTNFIFIPDEDKDGNPRVRNGTIDLGAYEEE